MMMLKISGSIGVLAAAGVALAQPAAAPHRQPGADVSRQQLIERVDRRFQRLDADGDGRFTREEGRALREQRRAERRGRIFDRLDTDRNGAISRAEFDQAHDRRDGMRAGRMMRRGQLARRAMIGRRLFGEQGEVTREQMRARALARFDRLDADGNGILTATERRAARQSRRARTGAGEAD